MTTMTAPRRRGNRHSQLPPLYICMGCREGLHGDCLNMLSRKHDDLCHCSHDKQVPRAVTASSPAPARPKTSMEVKDADITSFRSKAGIRKIEGDSTSKHRTEGRTSAPVKGAEGA